MTHIMTPSTAGQINKAVANYRAMLEKHSDEFPVEAVQTVLGQSELAGEQLDVFRRRVEKVSNIIVRTVRVDRSISPQAVLDATGRVQNTNDTVVKSMPKGEGEDVKVFFFKLDRWVSDAELDEEYKLRGMCPADAYSLAKVNEDDSAFADDHPNGTHWQDDEGNWCYAAFRRFDGKRDLRVNRSYSGWDGRWRFAGVSK
jgi:hypothetical protein